VNKERGNQETENKKGIINFDIFSINRQKDLEGNFTFWSARQDTATSSKYMNEWRLAGDFV
jgi:hypothetical protein